MTVEVGYGRKGHGLGWRAGRVLSLGAVIVAAACSSSEDATRAPSGNATAAASSSVVLTRSAHPLALPQFDAGRLDPQKVLHNVSLVFKLTDAQRADRDALLVDIQRPGSPSYHHWLTPEDYAARFGAKAEDIARASSWLASQGLTVHEPSRLGTRVTFTGTVAQFESAFQTEMHQYDVGGERHYAMARPPSVPADIGEHVLGVYNAHDFYPRHGKPNVHTVTPEATCPAGDLYCNGNGIAPPDWSFIYDVGPLYNPGLGGTKITGTGVTIAIVGITDIAQSDLTAFRTRYGFTANNIVKTLVPNTGAAQGANGAGIEAVLDTEWAGTIAPAATIDYVYTGAGDANVSDAVYYAIEQNYGDVLSESWGGCEQGTTTADADVLEIYGSAANLEGTTYLAASGDSGAADCQGKGGLWVNMPASFPGVTSVGGTGFSKTGGLTFTGGNVTARGTEAVWNESNNAYTGTVGAGGGGISSVFARPLYQSGITTCTPVGSLPSTVVAAKQREVPDLSFTAAGGTTQYGIFIECSLDLAVGDCNNTGGAPMVVDIGGTSASTPSFAGVVALANQATGSRLGNVNPLLYAIHGSVPSAFHDVTTGNNEVICRTADPGCPGNNVLYGFPATAGYDCATGLGSLDATIFVTAVKALTPTATAIAAPTTTTEGASVVLTATVDVTGTNTQALQGDVTFTFQSYLANGGFDESWTLGEVAITNGTVTSGTATLTTAIPPGMVKPNQTVDVFAMYGGDANHLPSHSAKQTITIAPVAFCVSPATDSVAAGATINYVAAGGVAPYRWYIDYDSTCVPPNYTGCSNLNVTTGVFTAGTGAAGYVIVTGVDADGAETFSEVTVAGGSGTIPWSTSGPPNYAGIIVSKTALTACPSGDNCGSVSNGCGGTVNCGGACPGTETCGGGGVPNQCGGGCVSNGMCTGGATCGTGTDNCGNTISCGPACVSPQTCGGGGVAGQCGCTKTTCAAQGAACGTIADGCGGMLACPMCVAGDTCVNNQCVAPVVDAGTDSGTTGNDGGTTGNDSGTSGGDSGTSTGDSGIADAGHHDSGIVDSGAADTGSSSGGNDSGSGGADSGKGDGSVAMDSGSSGMPDAAEEGGEGGSGDGGGGSAGGSGGGCGCRTAGSNSTPASAAFGLGAVLLLGLTRARRRRSRR